MSWSGRYAWAHQPRTDADREFLRRRVEHGFYLGKRDTAQIASETGYDEATIARVLSEVREGRRARSPIPLRGYPNG